MNVSPAGIALLKEFEGLRLTAYLDAAGVLTVGYGHTGPDVTPGLTITQARAEELLREDLRSFEYEVARLVTVPLTQPQFDALVSLTYNIGSGALAGSTLLKKLNEHDYRGASSEFLRWIHAGGEPLAGLRNRRVKERALFLSGGIDTDALAGFDSLSPQDKPANSSITAKPMAPLVPALIGLLSSVAPDLLKIFTDKDKPVSERNTAAAMKVLEVAQQVAQAGGPAAAVEQITADPVKQQQFREAIVESWYELSPGDGGGVTGARQAAQAAAAAPGWQGVIAVVGQAFMDVAVVGGGGYILWTVVTHPSTSSDIRSLIIGSIAGYIAAAVQFRYGSSVSSRAKDAALIAQR